MISVTDLIGSDGSNASETTDDSDEQSEQEERAELREVCERLGADFEQATAYVDEHGRKDALVEFAEKLEDNEELVEVLEQYRQMNDIHRIIRNHLRDEEQEFTTFTGTFYGDSSDPSEGTYNWVQQRSKELNGNLMFYRALFPEPRDDYWASQPVLWQQFDSIGYADGQQDSHIYVSRDFVDEYSSFTLEIDGEARPRPPANDEIGDFTGEGSSDSSDSLPFDPAEFTIPDLKDELESVDYSADQLDAALDAEEANKDRKGAKKALGRAIEAASGSDDTGNSNSGDNEGDGEPSSAAQAGEMHGKGQAEQIPPEKVKELMDNGWEKEEIIEFYG